jgi:hypothetical protein
MDQDTRAAIVGLTRAVTDVLVVVARTVALIGDVQNEGNTKELNESVDKTVEDIKTVIAVLERDEK